MRVSQEFGEQGNMANLIKFNLILGNRGLKLKYPQFGTGEHKTVFRIKGTILQYYAKIMKEKYSLTT